MSCGGHLSTIFVLKNSARTDDVCRFGVVEPDSSNIDLEFTQSYLTDSACGVSDAIELSSGSIDRYVSGLSRQNDSNEQLERAGIAKFGSRRWCASCQNMVDLIDFFGAHSGVETGVRVLASF